MKQKTLIPRSQRNGVDLVICIKDILDKKISCEEVKKIYLLNLTKQINIDTFVTVCQTSTRPGKGIFSREKFSTPIERLRSYCGYDSPEVAAIRLFLSVQARAALRDHTWNKIFSVLGKLHGLKKIVQPKDNGTYIIPEETYWIDDIENYKVKRKAA